MDWMIYSDKTGWERDNYLGVAATRRSAEFWAEAYPCAIIENRRTGSCYQKTKTGKYRPARKT